MKKALKKMGSTLAGLLFGLTMLTSQADADYVIKDGNAATQTILAFTCATTKICPGYVPMDLTGAAFGVTGNPFFVTGNVSNAGSGVATGSGSLGTIGYLYGFNGTTWDQLQVDASKFLKINCAAGCTGASDTTAALSGMTANNAATQIALVGTSSVSVLLSGTWTATITPEVSADGGTTWVATQFWNVNTHASAATVSANGTYDILGTGGKSHARVRISAFTSGTVTGNLKATSQAPSASDALAQLNSLAAASTPAGSNVIGKVGIDQTTPGTTNGVQVNAALPAGTNVIGALTANQSVNLAQVAGVATPVGSGVQATAPRMTLATDSPGIFTLGPATVANSFPYTLSSQYPTNATTTTPTPITGNATGTTAAVVGTLTAAASVTTFICGFSVDAVGGTAAVGPITVAGLVGSSMVFQLFSSASGASRTMQFNPCIPASAANTAITVTTTANGTATAVDVNSWGYRL